MSVCVWRSNEIICGNAPHILQSTMEVLAVAFIVSGADADANGKHYGILEVR